MSSYFWFGLAMLAVVVISLLVTGNLAAMFNERAKSDLKSALEPLAAHLDGQFSVDEARVSGRFRGQISSGQVIAGPGGMGRLFQTTLVEPAGGSEWTAVVRRPKSDDAEWERSIDRGGASNADFAQSIFTLLDQLLPFPGWFEMKYLPAAGEFKLTRAMQSRRDLPTVDRFAKYLDSLERAAALNRAAQSHIDAD